MRRILVALLLLSLVASSSRGQAASKQASPDVTEATIIALENDLMNAVVAKNEKALDRIIADDFLMLGQLSMGELLDKKAFVQINLKYLELLTFNFEKVKVQIRGDTAVFHCKYNYKANYNGQPWNGEVLMTDTWVKQGDRWLVLSRHSSKLPSAQ